MPPTSRRRFAEPFLFCTSFRFQRYVTRSVVRNSSSSLPGFSEFSAWFGFKSLRKKNGETVFINNSAVAPLAHDTERRAETDPTPGLRAHVPERSVGTRQFYGALTKPERQWAGAQGSASPGKVRAGFGVLVGSKNCCDESKHRAKITGCVPDETHSTREKSGLPPGVGGGHARPKTQKFSSEAPELH